MNKNKHRSTEQDKNSSNIINDSEGRIPNYEADDGMVTDVVIEQIKKLVPQIDFNDAESLF